MKNKGTSHHESQRRKEKQPVIKSQLCSVLCSSQSVPWKPAHSIPSVTCPCLHRGRVASAFDGLLSSKCLGKQHPLPFQQWTGMLAPATPPPVAQLWPHQVHQITEITVILPLWHKTLSQQDYNGITGDLYTVSHIIHRYYTIYHMICWYHIWY